MDIEHFTFKNQISNKLPFPIFIFHFIYSHIYNGHTFLSMSAVIKFDILVTTTISDIFVNASS